MALYSLKKISLLAESRQAYLRGVSGYNAGWVRAFSDEADPYYSRRVTAQVEEAGISYAVEVGFDSTGEAAHLSCGCSRFAATGRGCKHVVATLVYTYYRDMTSTAAAQTVAVAAPAVTDPAVRLLMDAYLSGERVRLTVEESTESGVTLTPVLHLTGRVPTLTFTVGREKPYQIKNVARLAEWMERGEVVEYGRELTLLHHRHSFAPESRPLLDFLLAEVGAQAAKIGVAVGSVTELSLSKGALDRFFTLWQGAGLTVHTPAGERRVTLTEGQPTLTLTVEQEGEGVRLYGDEAMPLMGARKLYLLYRGRLYRTNTDYTRRMAGWVTLAAAYPKGLHIAPAELPAFCGGVLAAIRPYVSLQGESGLLDSHTPPRLFTAIHLHRDGERVTAQVEFIYGGRVAAYDGEPQPWQDPLAEFPVRRILDDYFADRTPDGALTALWEEDKLYRFLTVALPRLRRLAEVTESAAFGARGLAPMPALSVGVSLVDDLLRMTVDLEDLDPTELAGILTGYREGAAYHRLRDGRLLPLQEGGLTRLAQLTESLGLSTRDLTGGEVALPTYRALYLDRVLEGQAMQVTRDRLFMQLTERHRRAAEAKYDLPACLQGVLRGYQRVGFRWLRSMEELGFGGILADDMGLGKTVQMIALFAAAKERGITLPSLVVCPTSVVLNWERELGRFAPHLRVLCVIGDAAERHRRLERVADYDVVVTSYDILKRDVAHYADLDFYYHVLDEAQYIKNSNTQNARAVKSVRSVRRFALTGTPVENRLAELWSIFDFLMPGFLFTRRAFMNRFEAPIQRQEGRVAEHLRQMVAPFILRRLKQEVLTELPPKTERLLPAPMERPQRQVYLAAVSDLRRTITGGGKLSSKQRITVLSQLTRLRQICCDPRLCCEGYNGGSAKLDACMELLREATAAGHKVLLFSQFTSMLALLRQRLEEEGVAHFILQGSTPKEERARLVDAFNGDDTPVFLISLKAGGVGLNLTGADMVIHYDPWWNGAVEDQATDRAHRIGQKNPVQVVRLIARDTIEEKIVGLQEQKRQLAQQVVEGVTPSPTDLTAEQLLELLE